MTGGKNGITRIFLPKPDNGKLSKMEMTFGDEMPISQLEALKECFFEAEYQFSFQSKRGVFSFFIRENDKFSIFQAGIALRDRVKKLTGIQAIIVSPE